MRRSCFLFPLLLLLHPGCDSTERITPTRRARYDGPKTMTFGGPEAVVRLELDRFRMSIASPKETILETIVDDPKIESDASGAYGAVGATHHETSYKATIIEGWDHVTGTDDRWIHATAVSKASLDADQHVATLELFDPNDEASSFSVTISVVGSEVRIDARALGNPKLNQMGMSFALPKDEHFFGLGERYVSMDHRGRDYQCWTEEGGIASGEKAKPGPNNPSPNGPGMTHVPIPFFISSRGYGLWQETTYRNAFSLGADDERFYRVQAEEPALHLRVLVHDDPIETIAHFTKLTGRAKLPAPWVFGPRRRVDLDATVDGVPEEEVLRSRKVPTTALDDAVHFLPNGSHVGREARLAERASKLHALGYKTIGYFNAYVSTTSDKATELVAYGRAHDLFLRLEDGSEFITFMISGGGQKVATIDFTKPDAVRWYETRLQEALDLGYDGWMLDFGEYVPQNARFSNGMSGWEGHNAFPVIYQRATFDYLRKVRGDDFMFFARAGYTGTQAVAPVVWSGDPAASFDDAKGLPAQVRGGVSAGISGIPFWGSDIGGYACNADPPADKEVLLRWVEFGALSSDMHDENACAQQPPGSPPKWNIWKDAETTEVYGRYARLHTRLFPYLYAAAKEATERGTPVMRHPFLIHPHEPDAIAVDLEYYFGPSLYVAPVVRRGSTSRETWLPPGGWFDWWTMERVEGGKKITRKAPLDVLPLWLRAGGVVAMLDPSIETLAPAIHPAVITMEKVAGILDVRAALDATGSRGDSVLVDGTTLSVRLDPGAVVLPSWIATAPSEADLATCRDCGRIDALPGGLLRVRVTTASTSDSAINAGALLLRAWRPPKPTRFRWDVVLLPRK